MLGAGLDQLRRGDSRERQVEVAGQPLLGVAVEPQSRDAARSGRAAAGRAAGAAARLPRPFRRRRSPRPGRARRRAASAMFPSASRAPARRRRTAATGEPAAGAGRRARRCLSAHRSCGRRSTAGRSSSPRHRAGSCRLPAPHRYGTARRATRHSAPISASGWITPISLCAAMTETSKVRSVDRGGEVVERRRGRRLDRQVGDREALALQCGAASSTHLCSVGKVTM